MMKKAVLSVPSAFLILAVVWFVCMTALGLVSFESPAEAQSYSCGATCERARTQALEDIADELKRIRQLMEQQERRARQ